jgi:hypothetical protein
VPRPVYLGRLRLPTKMQMQAQPARIAADKVEPCPNSLRRHCLNCDFRMIFKIGTIDAQTIFAMFITSFLPHFTDKTTSVAREYHPPTKPHYLIVQF